MVDVKKRFKYGLILRSLKIVSIHITIIIIILVLVIPVQAQSQVPQCAPLDIVVLLDQSRSMAFSDPESLRLSAIGTLITTLYDNAAYECPGTLYRIGVIGFGDDADTLIGFDMPEGQIQIAPGEPQAVWASRRATAEALLVVEDRSNTNYRVALEAADAMLTIPSPVSDDAARERIVVMLVDGTPCSGNALALAGGNSGLCGSPAWIEHYLRGNVAQFSAYVGDNYAAGGFDFEYGLENFLLSSNALGGDTQFNIIFFTNKSGIQAFPSSVDDIWETITTKHGGIYFSPSRIQGDLRQIAVGLDEVVASYMNPNRSLILFNPDTDNTCLGRFILEPYLSSATLVNALRGEDGSVPELLYAPVVPSSDGASMEVYQGYVMNALSNQFMLSNPIPGEWALRVQGDCETADARVEFPPLALKVIAPSEVPVYEDAPFYRPDSFDYVWLTLTNAFGQPVTVVDNHPLDICGTFTTTNPAADNALNVGGCFIFTGGYNGIWRSVNPLPSPNEGSYQLNLEASVLSVDPLNYGTRIPIFRTHIIYTATHNQ